MSKVMLPPFRVLRGHPAVKESQVLDVSDVEDLVPLKVLHDGLNVLNASALLS